VISQGSSGEISQGRNRRDQPEKELERSAREGIGEIRQGKK
jgi:hypothetical protein